MIGTISIILVLGGLIFFHELGHFLMARALGIGVKTFSVGFGPALLSKQGAKTRYQLSVVPLGGYVSLLGEHDEEDLPPPFTRRESFALRPAWQRLLVVAAGPVFNLVLALLLFWFLFWQGNFFALPEIGQVQPGSPAAEAGLEPGDIIRGVDGENTPTWNLMFGHIQESSGREMLLNVERNGQIREIRVAAREVKVQAPGQEAEASEWQVGIISSGRKVTYGFAESARLGYAECARITGLIGDFVKNLFTGRSSVKDVGGPVLLAQIVHRQADAGLMPVLYVTAFISINLGLLNLLPIPALDGGHILFYAVEMIFRRPVPPRVQNVAMYLGLGLLITLMLMATVFDIFRLVT
ncbi:RIP metalloprotease RseP [Desulfovibrio sp. OttesenSCG-928-C14]|nr:RIP metalloprotease RseP [Desulfovibrio sp. OttesenSCG-928-C14]